MEFEYKLIRAKRKTVGITVGKDGAVTVRAPKRLSKKEIEKILIKHTEWIRKKQEQIAAVRDEELTEEDELYLRALAKKYIPLWLESLSQKTGLKYERVRISSAKKRYGSCSSKGSISISYYVMLYPERAIELVLVHELCHLRHMDHSRDFYSLLSSYLPDHRERKKLLSKGRISMEDVRKKYGI
jgi:predicted metal-dependent hydrolase